MSSLRKNFKYKDVVLKNFVHLSEHERELVRKWRNNPGIKMWMYSRRVISAAEHKRFIESLKHDNKNYYWLVKLLSGDLIGVIYLNRVDLDNRNAYMGIYANPDLDKVQHKGSMLLESIKMVGFNEASLHTIKLEVVENNLKAIAFYKKNGFIEEGLLKEYLQKGSGRLDVIIMGIFNERKRS